MSHFSISIPMQALDLLAFSAFSMVSFSVAEADSV
jgi:hypothetical protein